MLWDGPGENGTPDIILLATGSEVSLALDAARLLGEDGVASRVVSMPCWELFELQSEDYRDEVLPPGVEARLAIETGVTLGWHRWVGDRGDVFGVDRFGASAPGATVLEKFGFTPQNLVSRAEALLERRQPV